MEPRVSTLRRVLTASFTALLLLSALFLLHGWWQGHFRSADTLRVYLQTFGLTAPLVLVLIQAMQVVLPVLPGFLGCIVGAALFGASGGFWCNYIGISLGSIAAYFLARHYGTALVTTMIPPERYHSLTAWVQKKKSYTVVFALAILLPLAPDDFFCYFSGLTGMSARRFVWIIVLAKPWCILAYCLAFAKLI